MKYILHLCSVYNNWMSWTYTPPFEKLQERNKQHICLFLSTLNGTLCRSAPEGFWWPSGEVRLKTRSEQTTNCPASCTARKDEGRLEISGNCACFSTGDKTAVVGAAETLKLAPVLRNATDNETKSRRVKLVESTIQWIKPCNLSIRLKQGRTFTQTIIKENPFNMSFAID